MVWRETRADAVAEIIDRITAELSRGWEAPAPKLARTFHVAWLAAAADDIHRGWAARHLLDKLPDRKAALRERLGALWVAGPDPRVGRELCRQLDKLVVFDDLEELVTSVIVESGDGHIRASLEETPMGAVPAVAGFVHRLSAALANLPSRPPSELELARLAPPVRTPDLAALERDVYANPDDDEPRAVLADLLQSRGDPRGELIALQLAVAAGRGSDDGDARIAELVRDHGRAWLGPLSDIAYAAEFRRGFLSRLELAGDDRARPARWENVVDHPLFGTVEDLIAGECSAARYAELIASPAMKTLRRIEILDTEVIEVLERVHAPIVHVSSPLSALYQTSPEDSDRLLAACARIETIRSFACELEAVPLLMRTPIGARLTTLTVVAFAGPGLAFWRNLRAPLELVITEDAGLRRCTTGDLEGEGEIRVRREDGRVIVRVVGPWGAEALCDDWGVVNVDRLEIVEPISQENAARLEQLAKGREIIRIPRERRAGIIT